jgi:hypothetical protein
MVICAHGKSISRFTIVQYGTLDVYPAWQLVEDVIAYAKSCCVLRELTPKEGAQFGS